jgi:hypothetical protein
MLLQVYGDNAVKKTAVYKWVTQFFWGNRKCHWWRDIRMASNEHSRASEHRHEEGGSYITAMHLLTRHCM